VTKITKKTKTIKAIKNDQQALLISSSNFNGTQVETSKLAAIVECSEDAILSQTLEGIVTTWNNGAENMYGYKAEEIVGKPISMIFPADRMYEDHTFIQQMKDSKFIKHFETERIHKNGSVIPVSLCISFIKNAVGEIIGIAKIARDISLNKIMERALACQHEKLRVTMNSIGDAVITTDINGEVQYLNPVAEALTGWTLAEAIGRPLQKIFHIISEETRAVCINPAEYCINEGRTVGLADQTVLVNRNGTELGINDSASPIKDADGQIIGVVLVFRDATLQRKMEREISYRATHDMLTGLINRSEFELRLKCFVKDQREPDLLNALLYIDLDQFKVVNDSCGHAAGDSVLKEVSKIMLSCIRNTDVLARIGGDEFAIILYKCDTQHAIKIAKKICKLVDEYRFSHNEQFYRVGTSIGLVIIDQQWDSDVCLMQAADSACYEAKRAGRNRVHLHINQDNTIEAQRGDLHWVSRIEHALDNDGFVLFCQRIMPLKQHALEHAEVLIRMKDKAEGLISPTNFLPAAERYHMVTRIDRWVVKEVLEWLKLNATLISHVETISINLSGQSLSDLTFHAYVLNLIETIDVDCNKLCFEVTETSAITNISDAKKFIELMNAYGIKFSLDDFGSGVSSFGYLKNLPVDYLKIDGQFINDLLDNEIGQATVRCITEVAKVTGKKTIAEWVDNESVEKMLKKMGVDFTQGFMNHKPAPLDFILEKNCSYASRQAINVDQSHHHILAKSKAAQIKNVNKNTVC
jgi:diguanylate cyclase (GGDEF)-like protein/PAS domain S-box-containing protein